LFVQSVTSNNCRDGFQLIGQECYNITNNNASFVGCAKICEEGNGTLPCIKTKEQNKALFEHLSFLLNESGVIWVGLYQDPDKFFQRSGWKNWHREGCDSELGHWEKGEPDDFNDFQESCAAVFLPSSTYKWDDASCPWNEVQCVCQEGGERSMAFDKAAQEELSSLKSKYWNKVGFVIIAVYLITALISTAYGIYTFRKMKHTKERCSHVLMITLYFMMFAVASVLRLKNEKKARDASSIIFFVCLISMIAIVMIQAFSLLDSIVLAIGGVREAKKSWIKRIHYIISFFTILGVSGAFVRCIVDFEVIDRYKSLFPLFFLSEFMFFFSSVLFIGVAIVFLSLYVIFSGDDIRNIRCQKTIKTFIQWSDIGRKRNDDEHLTLQTFKNAKRNREIQLMSLYWGILLSIQVILDYCFLSYSYASRLSLAFVPTLLLMILLLRDINKAEIQGRESFKKKSFYWKSIQFKQNGIEIRNTNNESIVRKAPQAARPKWLSNPDIAAKHQSELPPEYWTISIFNLIRFFEECAGTQTWLSLALARDGEENITMHDINTHFVVPWSLGTGSSIGLLSDPIPSAADLMISHSWSGSVKETINALKTLVTIHFLPKDCRVFFCTICQYQPEDGAPGGLTIEQQLNMNPFTQVITSRPKYGMYVVHTLLSEVYDRLWCVSEVYEARKAGIEITGIFDPHTYSIKVMNRSINIKTENASCATESDKVKLTAKIKAGGGFIELDKVIHRFRKNAKRDLKMAITFKSTFGINVTDLRSGAMTTNSRVNDSSNDE